MNHLIAMGTLQTAKVAATLRTLDRTHFVNHSLVSPSHV